jgi:SSS family solute:Na+ symporter
VTIIGLISSLSWGLGYFGQPHIIVRFMAIRSLEGRAHRAPHRHELDARGGNRRRGHGHRGLCLRRGQRWQSRRRSETIFIYLSQVLFHPLIGGFLLAAILAAIMSTISSQLLVASSSLTEDFTRPSCAAMPARRSW